MSKNVLDIYLRSENIPILWKKFYMKITNDRSDRYKSLKFMQHCHENHFLPYKWKTKTVSDCLSTIDFVMVEKVETG